MKEVQYDLMPYLAKGLQAPKQAPVNLPCLLSCEGVFPEDGSLVSDVALPLYDLSSLAGVYPYPQLFVLESLTVACTETTVYELIAGSWVAKATSLLAGAPWTVADFGPYIILSNGAQTVHRVDGNYTIAYGDVVPPNLTISGARGQVVLGSPDISEDGYWEFSENARMIAWLHYIIHVELSVETIW